MTLSSWLALGALGIIFWLALITVVLGDDWIRRYGKRKNK